MFFHVFFHPLKRLWRQLQRIFWKGWVMSVGGLGDVWETWSWIFGSESLGNLGHLEGNFLAASAADFSWWILQGCVSSRVPQVLVYQVGWGHTGLFNSTSFGQTWIYLDLFGDIVPHHLGDGVEYKRPLHAPTISFPAPRCTRPRRATWSSACWRTLRSTNWWQMPPPRKEKKRLPPLLRTAQWEQHSYRQGLSILGPNSESRTGESQRQPCWPKMTSGCGGFCRLSCRSCEPWNVRPMDSEVKFGNKPFKTSQQLVWNILVAPGCPFSYCLIDE